MSNDLRSAALTVLTLAGVTAGLYFAKPFLIPLALAMLLAFWLVPLVSWIERRGVGRTLAVLVVCLGFAAGIAGAAWLVGRQGIDFYSKLPEYRKNLVVKARSLRGPIGSLARANLVVEELESALETGPPAPKTPEVVIVEPESPLRTVRDVVTPLLAPAGTAGIVVVLVVFMLLQREDLRDRVIRLTGARDLTLTVHALDDASSRLSRYLVLQSLLCAAHGSMVGLGLYWIGIPSPLLWGVLAGLLRFIPYVGPWVAAVIPIAVAVAAFPSWLPAAYTGLLFIALELVSNNVLEPWVYGTHAGLSPFAVILSAFFWTWLWGLPGLFLAMPLTVCLVVLGRYVPALAFFRILFGDEAALDPDVRFYQRMVALDTDEVSRLLAAALQADGLAQASDGLVVPALRALARDVDRGAVTRERARRIREAIAEVFDDLTPPPGEPEAGARELALVVPGRGEAEVLASAWLARLLRAAGCDVETPARRSRLGIEEALAAQADAAVHLCAVSNEGALRVRALCKQLRARRPDGRVVASLWEEGADAPSAARPAGVRWLTRTSELLALLHASVPPAQAADTPPGEVAGGGRVAAAPR